MANSIDELNLVKKAHRKHVLPPISLNFDHVPACLLNSVDSVLTGFVTALVRKPCVYFMQFPLFVIVFLACFGLQSALAQQQSATLGVAFDGSLSHSEQTSKLTIKFDHKPNYQVFFMDNPMRLVVETRELALALPDIMREAKTPLVEKIRFGLITKDRSRLVLSLSAPVEIAQHELEETPQTERNTLTLRLVESSYEAFAQKTAERRARHQDSASVAKGGRVRPGPKRSGVFTIVIDSGHGGIDGGSEGKTSGVVEKNITLQVGKMLGGKLELHEGFHVVYTRQSDVFVSLKERQHIARRENGDLMISLHADSLRQTYVRGATVYTLADKASDSLAEQVAKSENLSDIVAGLAAPDETDVVSDILADLTLRETTHFSRAFAAMLIRKMRDQIELINNPHRSASFAVLKNAEVPSVLLELGYLSNAKDETLMANEKWQSKAANIVADAIVEYFQNRTNSTE